MQKRSRKPLVRPAGTSSRSSEYLATLEDGWQAHLAPRAIDAPTVISTFAGCGGSSLGYSMAGFRELLAVEWDDHAVQCFKLNFPAVPVYHGDIAVLSVEECLALAGVNPGELDVLDGSPPCQGFSTLGKRQLDDPRNSLFREFVRLLDGLQPRVFVMENVSGMVKGKMKLVFAEALVALKSCGYNVEVRLLNAARYGVPQSRQRIIFIGVRNGVPAWPRPHQHVVTVRDACGDLPTTETSHAVLRNERSIRLANMIPPGDCNGGGKYSLRLDGSQTGFAMSRLSWDKPSYTIPKTRTESGTPIVPSRNELIAGRWLSRLGAFPDGYEFVGNDTHIQARIGNSVPPLFMKAIAETLRREVLSRGDEAQ